MGRSIAGKELDATIKMDDPAAPIGIFGRFSEVNIEFPENIDWKKVSIHAQALAGDTPVDITAEVTAEGNRLTIPGSVINRVGLMAASEGDISDPGMVVQIKR